MTLTPVRLSVCHAYNPLMNPDFSSLFNWNTKQLFVYVLASYPSKNTTISSPSSQQANSEAIIWDTIIPAPLTPFSVSNIKSRYFPEKQTSKTKKSTKKPPKPDASPSKPGILKLANQKPKYQITDISGKLAERTNATLVVGWNVQPWVGALLWSNENLFRGRSGVAGTGRSRAFDFPALKGSRVEALKDAGVKSEGARVKPEAGSAEAVV